MSRRIPAAAALLILLAALWVTPAMAADAALPVYVTVSGQTPSTPETFTLTLRAASDGAPLPEGGRDGVYTCTVSGGGSVTLPIPCTREGRHLYTLQQEPGQLRRGTYDTRVYCIAATTEPDGRCTVTVYDGTTPEGVKCDRITFRNVYGGQTPQEPPRPSPKTGDGGMTLYAALALTGMAGTAVLIGRKKEF